jgi:NMD protein affecting ribosome stability and mRNA decay
MRSRIERIIINVCEMLDMICKICGHNETDTPDGICDDCKLSIISDNDIPPNFN